MNVREIKELLLQDTWTNNTYVIHIYQYTDICTRDTNSEYLLLKKKRHKIHDLELTYVPDDRPNMLSPNAAFV